MHAALAELVAPVELVSRWAGMLKQHCQFLQMCVARCSVAQELMHHVARRYSVR